LAADPRNPGLEYAWRRQSTWSQVADRLKREVKRWRAIVLALTIAGGVLSALAVVAGLDSAAGKVLAFVSAAAVGIGALLRPRSGQDAVRDWTRARSASEAIKTEVYLYLTGVGRSASGSSEAAFEEEITKVESAVDDLLRHTSKIQPRERPLPPVRDVDSYVAERVTRQIEGYYLPQAEKHERLLDRVRLARLVLGVLGALLAAAAGTWESDSLAVWVPVVTTVTAAVAAHAAAERYEYLLIEYLRTAAGLERLRDRRLRPGGPSDEEFVRACEHVISVQNEGWMAKLTSEDEAAAAAT
jgi:conflict system pore-forming effector with SLATT domain/uncharacterized protein DUF4231